MKNWLTKWVKYQISCRLDDGHALPGFMRRKISRSEELGTFENELLSLDHDLRKTKPARVVSPSLHNAIVRAVVAQESSGRMRHRPTLTLRWGVFAAMLVLAVAGWQLWLKPTKDAAAASERQSLSAAAQVLEASGEMGRQVPAAALAPLSGELERINLDLDNAAQFVIASLP
jgi:hypothetical protein